MRLLSVGAMTMFPHCELFPVKQCMDPEHCSSLGTGDDDDEQMGVSIEVRLSRCGCTDVSYSSSQ